MVELTARKIAFLERLAATISRYLDEGEALGLNDRWLKPIRDFKYELIEEKRWLTAYDENSDG